MDLEKGQVIIDFDFQTNSSFMNTLEFLSVVALKEAFDQLVAYGDIIAAVIEVKKVKPLWVVVRRTLPDPPHASLSQMALEAKINLRARQYLNDDTIIISFIHEDLP